MPSSPPCSHSTQLFPQNSNSNRKQTCQDRGNRIAADTETNEAFSDSKTNPAGFDKLEGCNPKGPRIYARRSMRARSTRCEENEAWAQYKKNSSRVSWADLSRDRYMLYQSQPPLLEIHLLEGYCSLETNATRPSKLHVPAYASK